MRQVVNLFIDGEEYYIDVDPDNVLDGQDREGDYKVLDITSESLGLDKRMEFIERTSEWFHMYDLPIDEFFNFAEYIFEVSIVQEEDIGE